MRRRPSVAAVLLIALVGLMGALAAIYTAAPTPTGSAEDRPSATVSTRVHTALATPAKFTTPIRQSAFLGASLALVSLVLAVRFANRETLVVRPVARARATRQRRAPPRAAA